jgi:protein-S-isoprenylcysteine O-methyltransferase Ste14
VVAGLYRYVRNPQYVGVFLVLIGEALLARAGILLAYAVLLMIAYHLFVLFHEEPRLGRVFGESYARYRETVPRWVPRYRR